MSKMIQASELRSGDMFELANGSVYEASGQANNGNLLQARLWCAHPPDLLTFEPVLIEIMPEQDVRLLTGAETEGHIRHEGFVAELFRTEMDRRNQEMMQTVYERQNLEQQEQRARERAARPWWKKLRG